MKSHTSVSLVADPNSRSCLCSLFITMSLICGAYFTGTAWLGNDSFTIYDHSTQLSTGFGLNTTQQYTDSVKCEVTPSLDIGMNGTREKTHLEKCNDKCRPIGTESLPKGIISTTSNLEMYPLAGPVSQNNNSKQRTSLLALAVGFKQKKLVNEIVKKFLEERFVVMLFHYDGVVNEWHDLEWNDRVIHVSATNQTKWWFAKRFLHPDIVVEYDYIFLWDEDLGVDNFHPGRYLSIIKEEGLEISQPALDPRKSKVHHQITVRRRSRVHRRYYRFKDGRPGGCDGNSTTPPCVGWVEMMAPVFSKAAWRCAWYMIQNDLIHAWGLDMQLGYCAQGDRTTKVGVVDEEYIAHLALPTLGGLSDETRKDVESSGQSNSNSQSLQAGSGVYKSNNRPAIRLRSYAEMRAFRNRWDKAVKDDECWVDPFKQPPDRD